jgi:hypothetical protein
MPNWCSNALSISTNNDDEKLHVDSLFNGKLVNRTDEITTKLRKILLAGVGGILHPSSDIASNVLEDAVKLHGGLATNKRSDDERSKAYSEFLGILVSGFITPANYDILDTLYQRTKLSNLWWGDISKEKRNKIKAVWKSCSFDFSENFKSDISNWWITADLYKNTSKVDMLDMRILARLPAHIMINGFNGKILSCESSYNFYTRNLGTKWPILDVQLNKVNNYVFDTAWSPARPIIYLLPRFVAQVVKKPIDDLDLSCNLFYFEPGCAFQGINDDVSEFNCGFNEDTEIYEEDFLPEIAEAFGID